MQVIIGFLGVKGAGKDTAAAVLVNEFGYRRIAFADALYREVCEAFGVTLEFLTNRETKETPLDELKLTNCNSSLFVQTLLDIASEQNQELDLTEPRSPRWILQMWGTEFRRVHQGYDAYWLDQVREVIDANQGVNFVITDVRYLNEATFVQKPVINRRGLLVRVRRFHVEALEARNRAAKGTAGHRSEVELLDYPADFEAINEEGKLDSLHKAMVAWVTKLPEVSIPQAA